MKFENKTKSILYGMEFVHGTRRALITALALVYFVSLGFSVVSITTLFAISGIIMLFFEFPTGAIADYDSRKKSIIISFFLLFVSFLGIFLFQKFWLIAFFWVIGAIAYTFKSGAGLAWAIDALKYNKKKSRITSLMSKISFFERSGYILGGLIGFVIVAINFRFIWLALSLMSLLMMFIVIKYMEEKNFKPENIPHNYLKKSLIKAKESFSFLIHQNNRELRILMLGSFLGIIAIDSFFVGVPLLFTQILNFRPEYISGLYSALAILTLVSPFIAEKMSSKNNFKNSLIYLFVVMGISIIFFAISKSLIFTIIALAVFKISLVAIDILEDSTFQHEFSSKLRASLGSLTSIVWTIATSIGIFLGGLGVSLIGIINTMYLSGGIAFVVAIIYLLGMKN